MEHTIWLNPRGHYWQATQLTRLFVHVLPTTCAGPSYWLLCLWLDQMGGPLCLYCRRLCRARGLLDGKLRSEADGPKAVQSGDDWPDVSVLLPHDSICSRMDDGLARYPRPMATVRLGALPRPLLVTRPEAEGSETSSDSFSGVRMGRLMLCIFPRVVQCQLCGLHWSEFGGFTLQVRTTGSLLSNALTLELGGGNNAMVPCRDHHVTVCVLCYVSLLGTCGIVQVSTDWCCTSSSLFGVAQVQVCSMVDAVVSGQQKFDTGM